MVSEVLLLSPLRDLTGGAPPSAEKVLQPGSPLSSAQLEVWTEYEPGSRESDEGCPCPSTQLSLQNKPSLM